MPQINWYPGHMAKSKRLLSGQLKQVDAVVELCDARAPLSTRNPDLIALSGAKARILVLNKADLADDRATKAWLEYFKKRGETAVALNAAGGKTREILSRIESTSRPMVDRMKARGAMKTVRLMVVGIPNVGKSTFINRLRGSAITKTGDKPGVTRASQWVRVGPYLELLDTPGMLWPKLEDQQAARLLAYLGSIADSIMDVEQLAGELLAHVLSISPAAAAARFKLPDGAQDLLPPQLLEAACHGRGWLMSGGRADEARGAALILDEFRAGRVGRITLEEAPAATTNTNRNAAEVEHGEGEPG
jgi:ribosome biogenesis GTPase A